MSMQLTNILFCIVASSLTTAIDKFPCLPMTVTTNATVLLDSMATIRCHLPQARTRGLSSVIGANKIGGNLYMERCLLYTRFSSMASGYCTNASGQRVDDFSLATTVNLQLNRVKWTDRAWHCNYWRCDAKVTLNVLVPGVTAMSATPLRLSPAGGGAGGSVPAAAGKDTAADGSRERPFLMSQTAAVRLRCSTACGNPRATITWHVSGPNAGDTYPSVTSEQIGAVKVNCSGGVVLKRPAPGNDSDSWGVACGDDGGDSSVRVAPIQPAATCGPEAATAGQTAEDSGLEVRNCHAAGLRGLMRWRCSFGGPQYTAAKKAAAGAGKVAPITERDVYIQCPDCACDATGAYNNSCQRFGGQCPCKPNVEGRTCNRCKKNYYGLGRTGCHACDCDPKGTVDGQLQCHPTSGQCQCSPKRGGRTCERCRAHWHGQPGACRACRCPGRHNVTGERYHASGCVPTAKLPVCVCNKGHVGRDCDTCAINHYRNVATNMVCKPCRCNNNINQLVAQSCDGGTGGCIKCVANTAGNSCEHCAAGYHGNALKRTCKRCVCRPDGTLGKPVAQTRLYACNRTTGVCRCRPNVKPPHCLGCQPNHFNITNPGGCMACACHKSGSVKQHCTQRDGVCTCKRNYGGAKCDRCRDGFFGDPDDAARGCQPCDCVRAGTRHHSGVCDPRSGACPCVSSVVGRRCDKCAHGYGIKRRNGSDDVSKCKRCAEVDCGEDVDGITPEERNRKNKKKCRCAAQNMQNNINIRVKTQYSKYVYEISVRIEGGYAELRRKICAGVKMVPNLSLLPIDIDKSNIMYFVKLPNIIIHSDRDVQRLKDNDRILVATRSNATNARD